MPESGLAKSRMKQYLESTSTPTGNNQQHANSGETDEPTKGLAKSLLAKWKSMESVKDKETSPEPANNGQPSKSTKSSVTSKERQTSPGGTSIISNEANDEDHLPQSGTAKSLLNKWQNIDSNANNTKERRGPRAFTPPPPEELQRNKERDQDDTDAPVVKSNVDEELALLKGQAKNTLLK